MNIIITEEGILEIERHGSFVKQQCPYKTYHVFSNNGVYCSHDCPFWSEVQHEESTKKSYLHICNNQYLWGEIIDERN